jgi:hypothetical protein
LKLKHLFLLVEKYCKRIIGQGDRQAFLYHGEEPTRTAENASSVTTIEVMPVTTTTHDNLDSIYRDLMNYEAYSLLDAISYMEGMSKWQR